MSLKEQKVALAQRWRAEGYPVSLIDAFLKIPREEFVPVALREQAYEDHPLPVDHEQTISQPSTIMIMLSLLEPKRGHRILEVGAGTGYVCAWLAELGCEVIGVELVPELAVAADKRLEELPYDHVRVYAGDGSGGWEAEAPYDRILFSAGSPEVPRHLLWQLKDPGILVAPVGRGEQRMVVCRKVKGDVVEEDHGAFLFLPLRGRHGVKEGEEPCARG